MLHHLFLGKLRAACLTCSLQVQLSGFNVSDQTLTSSTFSYRYYTWVGLVSLLCAWFGLQPNSRPVTYSLDLDTVFLSDLFDTQSREHIKCKLRRVCTKELVCIGYVLPQSIPSLYYFFCEPVITHIRHISPQNK